MKREDEFLKEAIKTLDIEVESPQGSKERIFQKLLYEADQGKFYYSFYPQWVLEKFLKLTVPISILVTILMRIEAC